MNFALALLVALTVGSPSVLIFDAPIALGILTAAAGLLVSTIAFAMRPGEIGFLISVIRPFVIAAAIPAIWMILQMLPLHVGWLSHPIWDSAAAALGRPIAGTISIDGSLTLLTFIRYLTIVTIGFAAAAVAVDRRRAQWILLAATIATALIAATAILSRMVGFAAPKAGGLHDYGSADAAALGVIIATAAAMQFFRHSPMTGRSLPSAGPTFIACLVAIAICCLAVFERSAAIHFAVGAGLATLVLVWAARTFGFGGWAYSLIAAVVFVTGVAAIALEPSFKSLGPMLAFADRAAAPNVEATQRILADGRWIGSGAGTFSAVLPMYRDINSLSAGTQPPNAVAVVAVELGAPLLWATIAAAAAFAALMARGAIRRGRDAYYAAAGSGCVVAMVLLAYNNPGVLSTTVLVIVAAVAGAAIAQSRSRSVNPSS